MDKLYFPCLLFRLILKFFRLLFTAYWGCLHSWVFFPLKYYILLYFSVSLLNPFSNSCLLHTKVDCSENLLLKYHWYLVIVLMLYFFFLKNVLSNDIYKKNSHCLHPVTFSIILHVWVEYFHYPVTNTMPMWTRHPANIKYAK